VRLSVIIPSLNQGPFIEQTIRSIVEQNADVELIVVDGGSTDATADIIRKYAPRIAYWISEPDSGQADAINKGLRKASGDVVTWFSADDVYAHGIFAAIGDAWGRNPRAIYAAPVANFHSPRRQELIRPRGLSIENVVQYWTRRSLWHDPGLFWSRAVVEAVGEVDASLCYAFDFDYLVRALQRFPVEYVDHIAAGFRLHRSSKTVSQMESMMAETAAVSRRYWHLVPNLDRPGFERSEFEARVRRAFSRLVRFRRGGPALLLQVVRERPLAALLRLASLGPIVIFERLRRARGAKLIDLGR
jgi:glycosyltransferase involved in cell wall biosynthesis